MNSLPRNVTALEGDDVTVTCRARANPVGRLEITWLVSLGEGHVTR